MADNRHNRKSLGARLRGFFVGSQKTTLGQILNAANPNGVDFGVTVNTDAALRFTAVFAAIKILSENIAALPKDVKRKVDGGYETATDHPAHRLLGIRPNAYTDRFAFWFSVLSSVLSKGNAYILIEFKGGEPSALHLLPASDTEVYFRNGEKVYVFESYDEDYKWLNGTYLEHEIIHVMLFSLDGIRGVDPITYNAIAIGRGIATQKFSADYYKRGGQIKGTLETDQVLGDEEYDNFMRHYASASGNFETPLLEYGIKYKSIGITPIAAQLIQSETLSVDDIARIFSVPPHLLAEMSHATFSNIEQQNIFFASFSLRPLCKRIEEQLELKLFKSGELGEYSIKFDLRGLMRGDDAARSEYYRKGIESGWLTPNEARAEESLRTLPGLDRPRIPLNTGFVNADGTVDNPNTENATL